jgi:hypothetical protein
MPRLYRSAVLTAVALLLAFAGTAEARIGETFKQCVARYGEPTEDKELGRLRRVEFQKEGVHILAAFTAADKCCHIRYYVPKDGITAAEVYALLRKNHDGKWLFTRREKSLSWCTEDGWYEAEFELGLSITTMEFYDGKHDARRPDLSGF